MSPEDYRIAIQRGIRKINYYSYRSNAGVRAARELLIAEPVTFYHDIADTAEKAVEKDVRRAMEVFMERSKR